MPPLIMPGIDSRMIAVLAALKDESAHGLYIDDYIKGASEIPDAPGIYLFVYEPQRDGQLDSCGNWFNEHVAVYAGMTADQTLKQRLAQHREKWEQVLENKHLLEPFGEEVDGDHLRLVVLPVPEEALVAEQTLIAAIAPIGQSPVLNKGGFGGAFHGSTDQWTLLGNLAVEGSPSLEERVATAADHVAPFLRKHEKVIEEFVKDKYYDDFLHS